MNTKQHSLEFYTHQDKLFGGLYMRPNVESDQDRVMLLHQLTDAVPKKILELGSGGGQFAIAAAREGHTITAIELNPQFIAYAKALLANEKNLRGSVEFVEGDFNEVEVSDEFDALVYWDGFGIGSDGELQTLLKRAASWLKPTGVALIDIYTPWNASTQNGAEMSFRTVKRKYGYDAENNRMIDTWWDNANPEERHTQTLRCFSPADLRLLLQGTGLQLKNFEIGPSFDAHTSKYQKTAVSLEKAVWFTAKLVRQ